MMEMYCLEVAPKADLATESTQKTTNATTNLNTEFAKWKAAEMFKVRLSQHNFYDCFLDHCQLPSDYCDRFCYQRKMVRNSCHDV